MATSTYASACYLPCSKLPLGVGCIVNYSNENFAPHLVQQTYNFQQSLKGLKLLMYITLLSSSLNEEFGILQFSNVQLASIAVTLPS